jgi:osmotically-inducible protein OsmY
MTSKLVRTGAALALAGLAVLTPSVAHASTNGAAGGGAGVVGVQETQVFTGNSYEQSSGKAKREAENQARRYALISGYTHEQCVVLYAYSDGAGFGHWYGYAAIRCTR